MKSVTQLHFFSVIEKDQLDDLMMKLAAQFTNIVLPSVEDTCNEVDWVHFVDVDSEIKATMWVSILVNYKRLNANTPVFARSFTEIRIYDNEVDMEFYQALAEYENKVDPNKILFN